MGSNLPWKNIGTANAKRDTVTLFACKRCDCSSEFILNFILGSFSVFLPHQQEAMGQRGKNTTFHIAKGRKLQENRLSVKLIKVYFKIRFLFIQEGIVVRFDVV